jgi:hypothetical protein
MHQAEIWKAQSEHTDPCIQNLDHFFDTESGLFTWDGELILPTNSRSTDLG